MKINEIDKHSRNQELIDELVKLWQETTQVTHLFLSENEIKKLKPHVIEAIKNVEILIVANIEDGALLAFMGINANRLEMLFVARKHMGKGIGTKLITFAKEKYLINELTVNEQNPIAIQFYEKHGFVSYKRTETDEYGNPYPLLYMKLGL